MSKPIIRLCLTPVRNEEWIIQKFLDAASCWADRIIVADQLSTDRTPDIVRRHPRGDLLINDSSVYDESHRTQMLLRRAREHSGKRILIALDADEALSSNFQSTRDWQRIQDAEPGTVLRFRWVNVLPGFSKVWIPPNPIACGYVDDGVEHKGKPIHSPRVPNPPNAPILDVKDFVVLHFQFVLWERMRSKQRWYQAWEFLQNRKGALEIFREYNHMQGGWPSDEVHDLRGEWVEGFRGSGVKFEELRPESVTWWDKEVLELMTIHGLDAFRKAAIWDTDWNKVAQLAGFNGGGFNDPRNIFEQVAHRLLRSTQSRRDSLPSRVLEKSLRFAGW